MIFEQPLAEANRNLVGIESAFDRKQPIAGFIFLADANRLVRGAVKFLADLYFDQRALFLDHDDQIEALGKFRQLAPAERPYASDFIEADAELIALELVDTELVKSLADIEIALAGGYDTDLRIAAAGSNGAIEVVGAHEGKHGIALGIVQARFLRQDLIVQPDIEAALGHAVVVGSDDVDPLQARVDRRRRFDRLVHGLERGPGSRVPRHRPAIQAVVENFLDPGRIEDRNHHVDEVVLRLVGSGGRFRGVIIAHQSQYTAVLCRAGEIGVAEHVAGAVDAGAFAVPHGEHAVVLALAAQRGLLRAPDRGGRQVFVDAALKTNVAVVEEALGAQKLAVEIAERRATVAGHVTRGIEAVAAVELLLHEAEPH